MYHNKATFFNQTKPHRSATIWLSRTHMLSYHHRLRHELQFLVSSLFGKGSLLGKVSLKYKTQTLSTKIHYPSLTHKLTLKVDFTSNIASIFVACAIVNYACNSFNKTNQYAITEMSNLTSTDKDKHLLWEVLGT